MWVKGEEAYENDSEHSFQLAMIALYIIEENKLFLDAYKCMGLALVHDILEVHAGDTYIYGNDISDKAEHETAAIERLKKDWPKQKLMHALIDEYEAKETAEAKFVYALDKLVPILNNYLDDGRNWKQDGITLSQLQSKKVNKISLDQGIAEYYQQIVGLLYSKPELFGEKRRN